VHRAFVYSLITLVIVGSCLLEYGGARWIGSFSARKQNRIAIALLGGCALALAIFGVHIALTDCLVLVGALVAGTLLGRQVGSLGALATMLTVAAIADLISTHIGPTRWLADQAQQTRSIPVLQFLAISIQWKKELVPVIGIGDLMFFAAVVSVVRRFGWSETSTFLVPLAGILSALAVGLLTGLTPALPFLAAAVLLYGRQRHSLSRQPCRG